MELTALQRSRAESLAAGARLDIISVRPTGALVRTPLHCRRTGQEIGAVLSTITTGGRITAQRTERWRAAA